MMKGLRFMRELFKDLSLKKAYKIYYTQEEEALLLWFWFCCCICNEWVLRGGGRENKRIKCMEPFFCLFFSLACHQLMNDSLPDIRHFSQPPGGGKKEYRKVVAAATKYVQDSPLPLNKLYDWLDSILTETLSAQGKESEKWREALCQIN